jgi:hypothetical protein
MNYRRRLDALPRSGSLLQSNGGKDMNVRLCVTLENQGERSTDSIESTG